jgi:NAD(P)-dependent dehydrogenase (short-subunit alcohol dehydrogenase family)
MVNPMRFTGRTAIVTGALGGIGQAVARAFAAEGANLMLADLAAADEAVLRELEALGAGRVAGMACDVADEHAVAAVVDRARAELGGFDMMVNVAGAMIYKPIAELTGEDWHRLLSVNLLGAAFFTTQALRHMPDGGAIVNVASIHAMQTSPLVAPYAAAKAALCSLTRTTAIEGKPRRIRANAILPGAIDTPMLWSSPNIESGAEVIAPDDVGIPQDIGSAATFLASDEARFISGASLLVDGGRLARL